MHEMRDACSVGSVGGFFFFVTCNVHKWTWELNMSCCYQSYSEMPTQYCIQCKEREEQTKQKMGERQRSLIGTFLIETKLERENKFKLCFPSFQCGGGTSQKAQLKMESPWLLPRASLAYSATATHWVECNLHTEYCRRSQKLWNRQFFRACWFQPIGNLRQSLLHLLTKDEPNFSSTHTVAQYLAPFSFILQYIPFWSLLHM